MATFDFAKKIALPHFPNPPAGLYRAQRVFVQQFGVYLHGHGTFDHYLYYDRDGGSGGDFVVSMLMHFLRAAPRSRVWHFVADNTVAQNRNNAVLSFFAWLTANRMFGIERLEYRFLLPGHTHNVADARFGTAVARLQQVESRVLGDAIATLAQIKKHRPHQLTRADFRAWTASVAAWSENAAGLMKSPVRYVFSAEHPWEMRYQLSDASEDLHSRAHCYLRRHATPLPGTVDAFTALPVPVAIKGDTDLRKRWLLHNDLAPFLESDPAVVAELCPRPSTPPPATLHLTSREALRKDVAAAAARVSAAADAAAAAPVVAAALSACADSDLAEMEHDGDGAATTPQARSGALWPVQCILRRVMQVLS
jgi:hypothetical protein